VEESPRYHVCTRQAQPSTDREIVAAFKALEKALRTTGFFLDVEVNPLDRDRLIDLWNSADGPVEATLPKAPGVDQGYVVTVRALDFVRTVLSDGQGKLRQRIFEENVRDYIGSDAEVNSEIVQSIADPVRQKRFGILNNGITLISSDVGVQGNELFLRDYQTVNGCQTSNVLFDQKEVIAPDATLMLKVVETSDAT
jgi:AIPR protein